MGRTRPAEINPQGEEGTHWHGVGARSNVTTVTTSGGEEIIAPAMQWGSTLKRARKQQQEPQMNDEPKDFTEADEIPADLPVFTPEQPKQLPITAEWVSQFMWTGGHLVGGLKVAHIEQGKGWQLQASDGRYLFLVNEEDLTQGMALFIERLEGSYTEAITDVFPLDMVDLIDDPMIGPSVAMMSPKDRNQ